MPKYALLIGVSEYQDEKLLSLPNAINDISAFERVLSNENIGGFDDVSKLSNPTHSEIRTAIAELFADKHAEDIILLYFSGHGVKDEDDILYLAAQNTFFHLPEGSAMETLTIARFMNRPTGSNRQIVILDCCYSGAIVNYSRGRSTSVGTVNALEGNGYGRYVMSACDEFQRAWEGDVFDDDYKHGLFTHFLVKGLETGEADSSADGWVDVDEWFTFAARNVMEVTNTEQRPKRSSFNGELGRLIVARNCNYQKGQVSIERSRPTYDRDFAKHLYNTFVDLNNWGAAKQVLLEIIDSEKSIPDWITRELGAVDEHIRLNQEQRLSSKLTDPENDSPPVPKLIPQMEEALQRIEDVKNNNGFQINLEDLNLDELPSEIGQLKNVWRIWLNGNRLRTLPSEMRFLTKLKMLYIYGNQFLELPEILFRLSSLETLAIGNSLTTLSPEIGRMRSLRELHLNSNKLTSLPPEIGQLNELESLRISENQLTELPPEIGQLKALRALSIDNNLLIHLPNEITQLTKLQDFFVSDNQLTRLPSGMHKLTTLSCFYANNNKLTDLPYELGLLPNIKHGNIDLNSSFYGNPLTDIDPNIASKETHFIWNWLREKATK